METFNLQSAWIDYLNMVKLDITKMSPVQITETKRAFMAGAGFMFRAFGRTGDLPMERAMNVVSDMELQIAQFWNEECVDFKTGN